VSSVSVRNEARQGSGEPVARCGADAALGVALAELANRSTPELQAEWRLLYRTDPPTRLSRDLLLRAVAHRMQERVHGGLSTVLKRRLDALAAELDAKGASEFAPAAVLKPGTRLVREWHGHAHAVIALEDGFEYQGERYPSLSKIATLITGTRWSGPVFFGLKKRPAIAAERSDG
jgi:Protein of unknown function (DUF2924)